MAPHQPTIGAFYFEKPEPLCWSLEDPVRNTKVYGDTAIPAGRYQLVPHDLHGSGVIVPKLLNVPFFDSTCIHVANSTKEILGCIAPGSSVEGFKYIRDSRTAFRDLMALIFPLMEKDEFFLTIHGGYEASQWEQSNERA